MKKSKKRALSKSHKSKGLIPYRQYKEAKRARSGSEVLPEGERAKLEE